MSGDDSKTDDYLSHEKAVYYSYGKKAFTESVETIKNFIQLMIPLTSGLITAYFAILKFLGIETALKAKIGSWPLTEPAVLLVVSLGFFIIASFPVPYPLAIGDLESIRRYRNAAIIWKYGWTVVAAIIFLFAMGKMVNLVIELVGR